jgi:UDP-N-acetylmuramoyl-L-alanyl-D-glutamate--2,6-diaminopimelate ligase
MEWWNLEGVRAVGAPPEVNGLTHDSRLVRPGSAFVAVPGTRADGHDFLDGALAAGAAALVVQSDHEAKWHPFRERVALVIVPDTRAAMGFLAAAVYRKPSNRLMTIGVTGTDGKTTTSHLIAHVLTRLGFPCGYLTSVAFDTGRESRLNASHMTTLEAPAIQEALADAVANGKQGMVVEASSEGLAQHRLDGCEFDVGVFTNLSRDHLDFHGTMEAYRNAKGRLFEMLEDAALKPFARAAIVNADDEASEHMGTRTTAPKLTYSMEREADLRARLIASTPEGIQFVVEAGGEEIDAFAPLFGQFNVYNCLAAAGTALSQGYEIRPALAALADFAGVPGRLERIDCGQVFTVIVDIASTPAALEHVLAALRPATAGKLWVVFGAAGGRDPARREGMGRVAGRLADRVVLTNEDPRGEDPDAIIAAIATALTQSGRLEGTDFLREPDRRSAIRYAFEHAGNGDTVLLAGKATEPSMVFGSKSVPWDERTVARDLLNP